MSIDGKTSRRSHDLSLGQAPLHLVSAFATTSRLLLGQGDKASELVAIPVLLERLATEDGLKSAIVTIDAIVRHFAINLVRKATEPARPRSRLRRATKKPAATPRATSIKLRRKLAGWDTDYLDAILAAKIR